MGIPHASPGERFAPDWYGTRALFTMADEFVSMAGLLPIFAFQKLSFENRTGKDPLWAGVGSGLGVGSGSGAGSLVGASATSCPEFVPDTPATATCLSVDPDEDLP